jgi:hypothetical protein
VSDILNPPSGTVSGRGDDGEYSQPGPKSLRCECGACVFAGEEWMWADAQALWERMGEAADVTETE